MLSPLRALRAPVLCLAALAFGANSLEAQFGTTRVVTGLSRPVYCTAPRGDLARLFILEQWNARILIFRNGALLPTPFLDINAITIGNSSEAGLLGLAFHPSYDTNGYFYVHYNDNSGNTVIARYTRSTANPDVADPNSRFQIYTATQPFSNHNGGWIEFGRDGYLYIALGDGGSANDPGGRAQSLTSPLGKMLRLDVDNPAPGLPYGIPPSNPFAGNTAVRQEIWHYGLRNPWRCSFDRQTGDMYLGDVGQDAWEEIDFQPATSAGGINYGWRCMEALACTGLTGCTCNAATLTRPIHQYSHSVGFSITGGYVYRGCAIPSLNGLYFFADYGTARIWSFRYAGGTLTELTERTTQLRPPTGQGTIASISSFGEDGLGELYICDLNGGEIFKIVPTPNTDCNANGRNDRCDLQYGFSLDLDGNGTPDDCQSLYADRATISVTNGGTQLLNLRGTLFQGGSTYLVAGSVSGTSPGFDLGGGLIVPLNPDAYFILSIETPNNGILVNSLGTLDAFGRAQASFVLPQGYPELLGLTVYHSWVRVLPTLDFASNFVKVDFVL
jgi:glucose/arabinose dehydrogenase